MGEMADLALEQVIDEMFIDQDDYEPDPDECVHIVRSRTIKCKFCGRDGYYWGQDENGKWRLCTKTGRLHTCSKWKPKEVMPE
jgi:hypothetical protein